jgi:topoisomerase IV subunit A
MTNQLNLADYADMAYLQYAIATVKDRALPQVEDGQKPVQKRILYAMRDAGLSHDAKYVKSARIVGDALGKYHPHGDTSVYDAMVRMAQDFMLRYPLISGQGNFGSRDGDSAAAMRYTEVRLSKYADLLLSELDEGTVDFIPNYDGAFQEPSRLPARLPMLLLNGASGIAVGMATNIPPHNLAEVSEACVAFLKNPKMTVGELVSIVKGPDFPGGGRLVSRPSDILQAYTSGRGNLRLRARWDKEDQARGQWRIAITELPYGVSTKKILEELDGLANPQPKPGKKALTPEQASLKQRILSLLDLARDESDQKNPVRLVLEPKTAKINPDELMQELLAHTSLEVTIPLNLTMVGLDGNPRQKTLVEIVSDWTRFRVTTVRRRTQFRHDKAAARLHIVEGRLLILVNIDEAIRIIREADDPKLGLMAHFGLSDTQAEDILEIRLRQLARLENIKLEKEREELLRAIEGYRKLLDSEPTLVKQVIREIEQDAKAYADDRRTVIHEDDPVVAAKILSVVDEPITVLVSRNGWLRARPGHGLDLGALTYKPGDELKLALELRTVDTLYVLGSNGRLYSIAASDIPASRGDGAPVTSMLEFQGGRPLFYFTASNEETLLVCGDRGYGFLVKGQSLYSRNRAGKAFLTLDEGEAPLAPVKISDVQGNVACLSSGGRLLSFPVSEVKLLEKGKGVMLMALPAGDTLTGTWAHAADRLELNVPGLFPKKGKKGSDEQTDLVVLEGDRLAGYVLHRARKGNKT